MSQDSYTYIDFCQNCNTKRSVSASRADIDSTKQIKVYAIACDHSWILSDEKAIKLREHVTNEILRQALKPQPHGLAIKEGFTGAIENADRYRYHVATYDCSCGIGYRIFVDEVHYDLGQRFQKYVKDVLDAIHKNGGPHPDVIGIPMEAEFGN